jgi:predicted  nucleic acid-binding Zn-ribbon protein
MHPPRVSDAEVRRVIAELTVGSLLPSGASIRARLQERFGSRGGVARIYRLLSQERIRRRPLPDPGSLEALQEEVQTLRRKLARTEEREDAHQVRWAEEVDQLRLKVAELESAGQQMRATGPPNELLRRQLQAAEFRAATLEQQLYDLTQREGQPSK